MSFVASGRTKRERHSEGGWADMYVHYLAFLLKTTWKMKKKIGSRRTHILSAPLLLDSPLKQLIQFSLNVFAEFNDKNICHYSERSRTCHPATSCVRDQYATTVPARHM